MAIWRPLVMAALLCLPGAALAQPTADEQPGAALDALHSAAARSDAPAYFDRLDPDLIWIGNDTTERWTRDGFVAFAEPYLARGEGWVYAARERRVIPAPDPCECLAWADEVLDSATYGTAVGNAVLRRGEDGEWRVWRYALTYPIPNDLARGMTGGQSLIAGGAGRAPAAGRGRYLGPAGPVPSGGRPGRRPDLFQSVHPGRPLSRHRCHRTVDRR